MKTHIPASLRKALLAALFATASIASTTYAVEDVTNVSRGFAETTLGSNKYSNGYTDLTFSGTNSVLGTVDHWCHDYNVISIPSHFTDRKGDDTEITLAPDERSGKYIAHSITADLGKDSDTNFDLDDWHDHDSHDEYGYSYSWSNGNIWVDGEAVLEVTTDINAHGTLGITGSSRVTAGNKVSAGEIKVTSGQLTAKDISVTANNLWNPGEADYDSTGVLLVSGSGAEVTATGTVSAAGGVNVSNGAHLNAGKITSNVTGSKGYVHALPNQNLVITDAIASEGTQYIVDNGCTIQLGTIGYYDEDAKVMHGNGNFFGFGADSNNIKADAVYVMGDIISDSNSLAALGSAVYDHMVDPNSSAILVKGSITGNGNELFVRSQDAAGIWVDKDISGNNNDLTTNGGDIHIGGTVGRGMDSEKGMAKGNSITAGDNITIHQLSDNDTLNIDAMNGEVTIEQAADATIANNSFIQADDDIKIAEGAASTAELKLTKSHIVSDNGDITIGQYVVADATSSIEAEEGDVNIHGLTANGATVKAVSLDGTEFIRLDGTGTTDTTVSVEEDMTSSNGSILIRNYNGEEPRITVGGDMRANLVMDIASANITVGGNQATETDSMSIDGTTLTVGGSQTSGKNLTTSSSKVDVAGDQSAVGRAEIHSTTLNVGGNQTSGKNLVIDSASKVTVGHVDEETGELVGGTQSSGKDIQIANSIVEVLRDQEATNGAITITGGSTVTVGTAGSQVGHVIDNPNYKIDPKETIYIGIIEPGDISSEERLLLVQALPNEASSGNQTAKGDITIADSSATIYGDQTSREGSISITSAADSQTPSVVHVGGNQTAAKDIKIANSIVEVLGTQEATNGDISITKGSTVTVAIQTAKGNITIEDSKVSSDGNQTATDGSIHIATTKDSTTPSAVTVGGDQKAGIQIKVDDSTLTVGTIEKVEDEKGNISYELTGGNQTAETEDIVISGSKVAVLRDQTSTAGNITISKGSDLVVGAIAPNGDILHEGNQTANGDISISDSKVRVLNDQTATEGTISIADKIADQSPTEVIVEGSQKAGNGISVDGATLTVGIIEEIEDEKGNISYELHGGMQTAETGDIAISQSMVNVLGDQKALAGSISVAGSTLTVGAINQDGEYVYEGSQLAKQNISITDSQVRILNDQTAEVGNITIADKVADQSPTEVIVEGSQKAGNGISVDGATLTVGIIEETTGPWGWPVYTLHGGMQTAETGDIAISRSTVNVLGDQTAAQGAISITKGTELTVGSLAPNGMLLHAGNQKAATDITVSDSTVNVLGDQIATAGKIAISVTDPDKDTAIVNVDGNQQAGAGISVNNAALNVGVIREFTDMWGQTYHWLTGGNQTADTGDIAITNSTANVLGNQEAVTGSISVAGSTLTVGAKTEDGEIVQKGNQTAKGDITIVDSTVTVLGNQKATEGSIAISSIPGTGITSEVLVGGNQEAGNAISVTDSQLTVGTAETVTDEQTGEQHVVLTGGNQTAGTGDIAITNSKVGVLGDQTATEGGIKIDKLSLVTIGMVDVDGTVLAGDQLAKEDIRIDSSTLMVMDNQTSQEGSISVQALDDFSLVMVGGSQTAKKHIGIFGSKEHEKPTTVLVGKDQIAGEGNIAINDAQVAVKGKVVALGDGNDGTGIVTLAGATYDVGVSLQAKELNIGTIDNPSTVTINVDSLDADGETPLPTVLDVDKLMVDEGNTLHTGNVKMDAADVTIHGTVEAGVKDTEDPDNDIAADWKVTGSHDISGANAHLMANGDIEIVAAEEGDTIRIAEGAKVSATGDVTIQGLTAVLAEVDAATVRAAGDITLDNAELKNNHETDITTKGSDIVLKNRVEISDTILNVLPPEEGDEGVINVAEGADVQLYRGAEIGDSVNVFNGKLAGTGSVTANDDNLTLYHDATAFNGTINLVRDNEQALNIACEGVGEDAVINLTEGSSLYTIVGGQGAHLGNVVTTDGSHIQLTAVDEGNTASATRLKLTSGTTYDVFATAGAETGALVSDRITVSDGINANGAKVAVHTEEAMETIKPGSRFTIVAGEVVTEFNEDVLYDRVKPIGGSSSTLRRLQTRNMHLEHNANGVDLVVSENYKGINSKNANVNAVREIIMPLDAAADHRPGVLAQSFSNLDHILDALDYTRSGGDAEKGLLSVSAAANLIVPNMMMDSTRHHLSTLRDHINAPVCSKSIESKGNVWAAYSGGHDFIGGDDNMDKYSHNYNGAIIGGDYAVNCNWAIGLSAGYEGSIARTTGTRADVDTTYIDAYAVGRTGKFIHKFSVGVGIHRSDVTRATNIAAKGHTYHGVSKGKVKSTSVNFGYDVARLYAINEVSSISPFFAVDLGIQNLKDLNERGQGDASVVTKYKNFTQLDAALGVSYAHTFQAFAQQAGVFSVSLAMHSEFSAHRATADNHFVDTPADTWKTRSAKRAPLYGELGGNVLVPFSEHFSGTAGMSFEFSADRTYIGGHAGVNYRF